MHSFFIIRHFVLNSCEVFFLDDLLDNLNFRFYLSLYRFNIHDFFNCNFSLNSILFIGWNRYKSINSFSDDLMFSTNQASVIFELYNSVNFNRHIILNVNSFFLTNLDNNFNWLFNESINYNWLDIRSLSRKDNWYFDLLFNRCEFLIYNKFSFSINFWFNNSNRLHDNFFNLDNVGFDYLLSNWNLDWNMNLFMLNKSRSYLDWFLNVSVNDFGDLNNKKLLLLNFNPFGTFNYLFNDIIDKDLNRNFFVDSYKLLYWNLNDFFLFNYSFSNHWNLFNPFNRAINFKIDVSYLFNFNWFVNIDDFFNYFFYNFDCRYFNNLLDNNFNNLRNFNWFLNHSWYNYYLFNNFFNLNDLWNFYKFVNDFLDFNFNLFYSFNSSWYFNDFLYNTVYYLNVFDVLDIRFLNLDNFRLFDNFFFNTFNWYNMRNMNSLDYNFRNLDINSYDSILENWDFNLFLNSSDLLDNIFNYYILNLFNFLWHNFLDNLFNNHLNRLDLLNSFFDDHRYLDSLRNINNFVNNSLNWY